MKATTIVATRLMIAAQADDCDLRDILISHPLDFGN